MLLTILLGACQGQPPLPIEAAAMQQELSSRLQLYRETIPGFEAEGTLTFTDTDGKRSAANWLLTGQARKDFTLQFRGPAEDEPVFVLQSGRDTVSVRLHAPGGREAVLYQTGKADIEATWGEPRLASLRLLLQALRSLVDPADFKVERVVPQRHGSELLVHTRSRFGTAQLRLRRDDAMPIFVAASSSNMDIPGCLEIAFPDKPAIKSVSAADATTLNLPAEAQLTWLPCCTSQATGKIGIKLRTFRIGIPAPLELPVGRVLPLRELARDRLWNEFIRGIEQNQSLNLCPAQ
jgi:hypothetical protein